MSIELKDFEFSDKVKEETQSKQASIGKIVDKVQEVKPEKPMSIEAYTNALRKEHEVAKLRAGIAKFMFEERMAMIQMQQMTAGQHAVQAANQVDPLDNPEESTEVD